jgi:ubiquinone/menaquinone biosynthesis C-methylase UbiE
MASFLRGRPGKVSRRSEHLYLHHSMYPPANPDRSSHPLAGCGECLDRPEGVRQHWENPATQSLADSHLKRLEIATIASEIPAGATVLDMGCGDGEGSLVYAKEASFLTGVDYAATMIAKATARLAEARMSNVRFEQGDVRTFSSNAPFSCVVTERCLINLESWAVQEEALNRIHGLLAPGGRYIMAEATAQGLNALNALRDRVGLAPTAIPWHNVFFDVHMLFPALERIGFAVRAHRDFGMYYFVSRVVHPLVVQPNEPRYDSPINRAAFECQRAAAGKEFRGVGPISVLVLERT